MAPEKAALTEVGIFGDNREPVRGSVIPNGNIIGIAQADVTNVQRVRKEIRQRLRKPGGNVLVE
jgi:hypothetical protein